MPDPVENARTAYEDRVLNDPGCCPIHGDPWVTPDAPDGTRRCMFFVPEFGVGEDYGCPQIDPSSTDATPEADCG